MTISHSLALTSIVSILSTSLHAKVSMPEVFADHMVLQRNHAVNIFGTADPGEKVSASFAGKSTTTTTKKDGSWLLNPPAMKASSSGKKTHHQRI